MKLMVHKRPTYKLLTVYMKLTIRKTYSKFLTVYTALMVEKNYWKMTVYMKQLV